MAPPSGRSPRSGPARRLALVGLAVLAGCSEPGWGGARGVRVPGGLPGIPVPAEEPSFYVGFSLNVHDWTWKEWSVATTERILDLHAERDLPLDAFLTDPVARAWWKDAPHLWERLRTQPRVDVSYHVRAPHPYYPGFDWLGLGDMDEAGRDHWIAAYEEHAIDLESGFPLGARGGYQFTAEVLGHPPRAVGLGSTRETLSRIYTAKGAVLATDHQEVRDLGERDEGGLWYRPEHLEIKIYEDRWTDGCDQIRDAIAATFTTASGGGREDTGDTGEDAPVSCSPCFVTVKIHENNFYASEAPWKAVYYDASEAPLAPPWDLDAWEAAETLLPGETRDRLWALWAEALDCVLAEPGRYVPVNLADIEAMLPAAAPAGSAP